MLNSWNEITREPKLSVIRYGKSKLSIGAICKHMAAWWVIGIFLGFLLAPNLELSSIIAFMIAGGIVCTVLGIVTYPLSTHFIMILVGGAAGSSLAIGYGFLQGSTSLYSAQFCLMIGALIGSTCLTWQLPLNALAGWLGASWLQGKIFSVSVEDLRSTQE